MKIVCLGDSLTGPSPGARYRDSYLKWPDLVQIGCDAVFGCDRVRVLNHGKAGEVSSGLRAAWTRRVHVYAPQVVVLWIGGNNYAGAAPKAEVSDALAADIRAMLEQASAADIRVLLVQYPRPRATAMERVWTHLDAGNDTIAALAAELGVPVLDLRPAFDEAAQHVRPDDLADPVDGVHLRPGGEMVVAREVLAKLRALGWPTAWPA